MQQAEFVSAKCDVYIKWKGDTAPRYRCYVNDELFCERTWIWHDQYLEENLQILAQPGFYEVRFELLDTEHSRIKTSNLRIDSGPAIIDRYGRIQIYVPEGRT